MQAYAGKVTAGKIIVAGNTAKTTRRVARAQKTVQVRGSARSVRFEAVAARGAARRALETGRSRSTEKRLRAWA